jgi:hypothetical protein
MNNRALQKASTLSARSGFSRRVRAQEKAFAENPAQPIDKSRFGRENPRKSKEFQPPKQGFPRRNGADPRKPKLIDAFRQRLPRPVRQSHYRLLAADPDVVLRVAGGIVRIAAGIIRAKVRLSRGIDRLIGVAAGERERHKSQDDRDPHSRPPVQWRRGRRTRELGVLGDQVQ